jgi:coatomer protein complex subunit gamma
MAQGVERFFKAAIVDKNPTISSGALVSAYHLFPAARDVVKRWANEVQESVNAKSSGSFFGASSGSGGLLGGWGSSTPQNTGYQPVMSTSYITQYHALGLLYLIRQQDRMAVTKMIQQFGGGKGGSGSTLKNSMAICMLVRYAAKIMEDDPKYAQIPLVWLPADVRTACSGLCTSCWRVGSVTRVTWSTTRQLVLSVRCGALPLNNFRRPSLVSTVVFLSSYYGGTHRNHSVLQLFLSSPRSTLKFAATRTLSSLAVAHPQSVAACNVDLENLIADPNRSVATYAITTLLKAGTPSLPVGYAAHLCFRLATKCLWIAS